MKKNGKKWKNGKIENFKLGDLLIKDPKGSFMVIGDWVRLKEKKFF